MSDWKDCKNILCIRPDNMGDLVMSIPAIRALKEMNGARITLLTSSMAKGIVPMIQGINDVIVYDLPWVKAEEAVDQDALTSVVAEIRSRAFDAAVVFTVYSQNPLPTVMLAWMAGIPKRLAYCRENPYGLLTDWVPDPEPYSEIRHQVRRDLELVHQVGAESSDLSISLAIDESRWEGLEEKLSRIGIQTENPWIILHPGVSEEKRRYPEHLWCELGKELGEKYQLLITGAASEKCLADSMAACIGDNAFSLAGHLDLAEFVLLISRSRLVISVNTGTVHLAAATQTPVVVLYALTNPQHYPWNIHGRVLTFEVPEHLKSRNEVIRYVDKTYFHTPPAPVLPEEIISAVQSVLKGDAVLIPELPVLS